MPDLIDELVAALPKDREKQPKKPQKDAIDELVAALPQEQMGIGEAFIDRVKQPGILTEKFPNSTMARIGQGALNALGSTGSVVASFLPAKRGTEDLTAAEAIRANLTPSQTGLGDLLPDFQDTPAQSLTAPNLGLSGAVVTQTLPPISAEDKKTAANLGIDIAADPTTYFGALSVLKLAKRFGKGSKLVKDAIETLPKDVQEVIQTEIKALPERASVRGELPERTSLLRGDEFITDAEGVTRRVGELPKEPKALKAPGARDEQGNIIAGGSTVPPKFKPLKALPSGEGKPRVREITGTDKTGLLSDAQKQQMKTDINRKMKKGVISKSEQKQMNLADEAKDAEKTAAQRKQEFLQKIKERDAKEQRIQQKIETQAPGFKKTETTQEQVVKAQKTTVTKGSQTIRNYVKNKLSPDAIDRVFGAGRSETKALRSQLGTGTQDFDDVARELIEAGVIPKPPKNTLPSEYLQDLVRSDAKLSDVNPEQISEATIRKQEKAYFDKQKPVEPVSKEVTIEELVDRRANIEKELDEAQIFGNDADFKRLLDEQKAVNAKILEKAKKISDKIPEIDTAKKPLKQVVDKPNETIAMPNGDTVDMAKQHAKTVEPPTQKVVQDAINGKVPSDEGVKQLDELNAKRAKERIQARKQVNSDQLPLTKKPILGEAADLTDVPVDKVGKSTMRQFSKEEQDLLNTVKKEFADDVQMQRRGSIPIEQTFIEAEKLKPEVSKLLDEGLPRGTTANAEEVTSMALINRNRMANIILDMLDNVPNKGVLGLEGVKSELGRAMNALRFVSDDPAISKQVRELLGDIKNGDLDKIISKAMDELPGYRKNISGQQQALDELKSKLKLVKKERPC